jgi:PEGA domain
VKPGYAPIEQYAGDAEVQQGPWTDIYGWGATAYFALTGKPPPPSASRIMSDSIIRLSQRTQPQLKLGLYSQSFLSAVDASLAVRPDDRPQTVAALKAMLSREAPTPKIDVEPAQLGAATASESTSVSEVATVSLTAAAPAPIHEIAPKEEPLQLNDEPDHDGSASVVKHGRPMPAVLIGLGVMGVVGAIALYWWQDQSAVKPSALKPTMAVEQPAKPVTAAVLASSPVENVTPAVVPPSLTEKTAPAALAVAPELLAKDAPATVSAPLVKSEEPAAGVVDKPATARLTIQPWGEVYVNGVNRGVSPPVKYLSLPPGDYAIEIKNGDYPSYRRKLKLKAGEVARINHSFVDATAK